VDNTQNIIELCAGYGGISMGIKRVIPEIRVRAFCEIEAYAVANLVEKIEAGKMDSAPIWTNLKTFPGKEFRGKIHGIVGGYPCQPFSAAGQRKGEQDPRHLFPDILRIVQAVEPLWCFFENVEGHLSLGFDQVYRSLRDLGYAVEAGLFSASECGAPHRRKRLFILAYSEGEGYKAILRGRDEEAQSRPYNISCNELAKSQDSRQRRGIYRDRDNTNGIQEQKEGVKSDVRCEVKGRSGVWPARPGDQQYEWENPRTIKSGLGRAVNGTAARVDRIRMLGNGVVPDTAELAFRTLINNTVKTKIIPE